MTSRAPEDHVRRTIEWHGGHTLVIFEEIGPQFGIAVAGPKRVSRPPMDRTTGREVTQSLCLTYDDVPVLEAALAAWRKKYPAGDPRYGSRPMPGEAAPPGKVVQLTGRTRKKSKR